MTSERLRKNQNKIKNSDDEDVVLACATKTLVCAAKTEHLLKKKAKKKHVDEELAYGKYSNILQELLLQDREHFRKYLRMNTTTFEAFLVFWCFFIHLFYFKRWIGFSLNFLYVSKIKTV